MLLKIFKRILLTLAVLAIAMLAYFSVGSKTPAAQINWGVSFSKPYAESLGLDWQQTYLSILDDLGVSHLRLSSYWNEIEPEKGHYDYSALDFQVGEASKRGKKIILTLGIRQPRWPECHYPDWAQNLSRDDQEKEALDQVRTMVTRYRSYDSIIAWQAENEFFVGWFGQCPPSDPNFLEEELKLIRSLDARPIILTDSGEMSLWFKAARHADIFGTTMYRRVYGPWGPVAWPYPPLYYPRLGKLVQTWTGFDRMIIAELQAEPWARQTLTADSTEENYKTFSPEQFEANIRYASATGLDEAYLWGAEWWYYMKEKRGVDDYWKIAKNLWNK